MEVKLKNSHMNIEVTYDTIYRRRYCAKKFAWDHLDPKRNGAFKFFVKSFIGYVPKHCTVQYSLKLSSEDCFFAAGFLTGELFVIDTTAV